MIDFMKEPCEHCPYRHDIVPYLTLERGEELAYATTNPYNDFPCHKTTVEDEDSEDGDMMVTSKSKTCAGFLSMQCNYCLDSVPEGFTPSNKAYRDYSEMIDAYNEFYEKKED